VTQLEAMALTYVMEAAVAGAMAPALGRVWWLCAGAAVAGSTVTHPILWAVFWDVQEAIGPLATPVLEACVIVAEIFAYRLMATPRWDEAALFSVLANAVSWWGGEAIHALT
jgi:hypothetical protein